MTAPAFSESLLAQGARRCRGSRKRRARVDDPAQLVGRNGKVIATGGAPGLAFSVHPHGNQRFNPLTLVAGTWPVGPGEVAIDANTAKRQHYRSARRSA